MRHWFSLLACLAFTVVFVGCDNPQQKKIDKAASQDKAAINEDAKTQEKAISDEAAEEKADVKAGAKAAKSSIDAAAKEEKEEAEDDTK